MATKYEYYYETPQYEGVKVYDVMWRAQSFPSSAAHKITSVKLYMCRLGGYTGTITVGIRATTGEDNHPTGGDLCSGTTAGGTLPTYTAWPDEPSWENREIGLGEGYNLEADTIYAIVVRAAGGNSSVCPVWADIEPGGYGGGAYLYSENSGSTWTRLLTVDCLFEVWGIPSPVVVTPGTLALTITTYAPAIDISDNKVVTPVTLSLSLTSYAPTVLTPVLATPSTLALTLTAYAPTIEFKEPISQVGSSADDVLRRLAPSAFNPTSNGNPAGETAYGSKYGCGLRFADNKIQQGANVKSAHIAFRARAGVSNNETVCNTRISAEAVDDAPDFSEDDADSFDARFAGHTIARVDWDNIGAWTGDADYGSPEIKTVIQEIVDRGGWASGNAIVLFWEDFDDRSSGIACREAYSYDSSPTYAPKLLVTYDIVATPGTLALTLTSFAPSVEITDKIIITPPTLALTLTAHIPTVSTPRLVTPSTLVLLLTTYAPGIDFGVGVIPRALALILTLYAPTMSLTITGRKLALHIITSHCLNIKTITTGG